ncbi:hypothetical protein DL98DRAFT_636974 [Cadophora sp. DSE1049]|nr:hypothetical protein DL98DRAFT_636974 [Cadophora sp. DSE1049]
MQPVGFNLSLAVLILTLTLSTFVSTAPYRPRNQHVHNEAHPIIQDHRHGLQNETSSTVVILPVESEDQEGGQDDEEIARVEIKTPHKLTPHIIVVQKIVDQVKSRIADRTSDGDDDTSEYGQKRGGESDVQDQEAESQHPIDQESSSTEIAQQEIRANEDQDEQREDIESGDKRRGNSTAEDLKMGYNEGGEGGREQKCETRHTSTSGLGPDDEGTEGMAILMGWTALVGVVGILAIAPAG